jgi:hypothetical protein
VLAYFFSGGVRFFAAIHLIVARGPRVSQDATTACYEELESGSMIGNEIITLRRFCELLDASHGGCNTTNRILPGRSFACGDLENVVRMEHPFLAI